MKSSQKTDLFSCQRQPLKVARVIKDLFSLTADGQHSLDCDGRVLAPQRFCPQQDSICPVQHSIGHICCLRPVSRHKHHQIAATRQQLLRQHVSNVANTVACHGKSKLKDLYSCWLLVQCVVSGRQRGPCIVSSMRVQLSLISRCCKHQNQSWACHKLTQRGLVAVSQTRHTASYTLHSTKEVWHNVSACMTTV